MSRILSFKMPGSHNCTDTRNKSTNPKILADVDSKIRKQTANNCQILDQSLIFGLGSEANASVSIPSLLHVEVVGVAGAGKSSVCAAFCKLIGPSISLHFEPDVNGLALFLHRLCRAYWAMTSLLREPIRSSLLLKTIISSKPRSNKELFGPWQILLYRKRIIQRFTCKNEKLLIDEGILHALWGIAYSSQVPNEVLKKLKYLAISYCAFLNVIIHIDASDEEIIDRLEARETEQGYTHRILRDYRYNRIDTLRRLNSSRDFLLKLMCEVAITYPSLRIFYFRNSAGNCIQNVAKEIALALS